MNIRFLHTNIIATNWESLSNFYIDVFGCEPIFPKRYLEGGWLDKGTSVLNAKIEGIHLRLPGYSIDGPTLEIFQYNEMFKKDNPCANRKGFRHIAFHVEDVSFMVDKVIQHGGKIIGKIVSTKIKGNGLLTFAYVTDPEENIIEIQNQRDN